MHRKSNEASRHERTRSPERGRARPGTSRERIRGGAYEPPVFEVICLACEVSAYAPDEDVPLL